MSRWDKIKNGVLFRFKGGIYPPENKITADKPIEHIPDPEYLVLPLKQHSGAPADILVKPGQHVLADEPLTSPSSPMQVPIHAPVSGTVEAVAPAGVPHPSGFKEPCIRIKCDTPEEQQKNAPFSHDSYPDYTSVDREVLLTHINRMGIAGLGGAGFPTDVKLRSSAKAENCQVLIINGAECEPYITCDDRLMQERADRIIEGIRVLQYILNPVYTVIAVENNKPEAIRKLSEAIQTSGVENTRVTEIPVKYPSGAARNLITVITGIEIPYNARSTAYGIVVHNVSTVYAVADAVLRGKPLTHRIVTVTGTALEKQTNVEIPLGYSIRELLTHFRYHAPSTPRIIVGGPMMGFTIHNADVPVIKTSNCIIAPAQHEIERTKPQVNCIRCGRCARACPSRLIPYELYAFCVANEHESALKCGLKSCIECGCCSFVCPSAIRLIAEFRQEKAQIKIEKLKKDKIKAAKERYTLKQQKLAEEERLRAERKAAALAKIKNQQASAGASEKPAAAGADAELEARKKAALEKAAAIKAARAKAKAEAAQAETAGTGVKAPASQTPAEPAAEKASKSADLEERKRIALEKAAAIKAARAKAKAEAAQAETAGTGAKALEKAAAIKAARAKAKEEAAGAGQAKETSADKNKGEQ
ncbi:electron transport complex protein RnfC [Ruminobacter amylophilus]|uniref:Ion-translocating oxidoreductase complex subunit C n=1 Tax=Ruminobacter amylophilus TaxID=867 RepID=A0A662ZID3_9GAMM|nr:electron transport complex subunit RsxC [Ruminobacter amylophilus]SFP33297.1 electron transport complex protein RnfC [Ruminobacter amylophilus]